MRSFGLREHQVLVYERLTGQAINQVNQSIPLLAFPVRDASIFVITALQIFSRLDIKEDTDI